MVDNQPTIESKRNMFLPQSSRPSMMRLIAALIVTMVSVCGSQRASAEVIAGFSEDVLAISDDAPGTVANELRNAIDSFNPGNDTACLERLHLCAERHPELPPAQVMLATLHCRFNQPQRARALLQEIESDFANDPGYVFTLARIYLSESRHVEGMALIDRAMQLADKSGWALGRRQRFVAQVNLQKLQVFESQKQWHEVANLLSESFQGNSNSMTRQSNALRIRYARALFFTGQIDEAKRQLGQSGVGDSRLALAQWHNEVGQYGEAEMLLRDVVGSTSNPMLRIALANYLLDRNKVDHAKDVISVFMNMPANNEAVPENPDQAILSQVGIEFEEKGVSQQALQNENVQNEMAIVWGRIAMLSGDWSKAKETLEPIYQFDSSRLYVANLYARALIASDNDRDRRQGVDIAFSKAAQHASDVECAATLAWAQLQLNQVATAESALMSIAARQEISADTAYFAAQALAANGSPDLAQSLVRRALDSDGPFDLREHANRWAASSLPSQSPRETHQVSNAAQRIDVAQRPNVSPKLAPKSARVSDEPSSGLEEPEAQDRGFVIDPDALFSKEPAESE